MELSAGHFSASDRYVLLCVFVFVFMVVVVYVVVYVVSRLWFLFLVYSAYPSYDAIIRLTGTNIFENWRLIMHSFWMNLI